MNAEKKLKGKSNALFCVLSLVLLVVLLFPLYWILVTSLKTEQEIFRIPPTLFPSVLNTDSYAAQLQSGDFNMFQSFGNSMIIALSCTAIAVILSVPASYGLARFRFRGKKVCILSFLITQMLPVSVILTPMFIIFKNMSLLNTYFSAILARVGEGIVSSIGSSENHKSVLENPDSISKLVLRKGLDAGTAFEILSIDIADIDIGKNIGAALQIDQANADKNIAQAKAEERRAMAVATEQEMKAKAQEARAKVIEAEAEVPKAMAEAFRNGNLGIMDYYRMKNIEADTSMRENIAKPTTGNTSQPLSK